MSDKTNTIPRATLLDGSRADAAMGILPRTPIYPPSNYTYAKRAERMRMTAVGSGGQGVNEISLQISEVAGSNTYARSTRTYGAILIAFLMRQAELAEAVAQAEAQIAEAVPAKPKKAAKPKAEKPIKLSSKMVEIALVDGVAQGGV